MEHPVPNFHAQLDGRDEKPGLPGGRAYPIYDLRLRTPVWISRGYASGS
jgi:hypothetical protein